MIAGTELVERGYVWQCSSGTIRTLSRSPNWMVRSFDNTAAPRPQSSTENTEFNKSGSFGYFQRPIM